MAPGAVSELDTTLDILGQQPGLQIYTQITLCYQFPDSNQPDLAVVHQTLTQGLERLSASFTWTAGQVINEGAGDGDSGVFKIKPLDKVPRLAVKDLRGDAASPLSMAALRRTHFSATMLDEDIIAPRRTLPSPAELEAGVAPVFLTQATFIAGGLLLTFVGQHAVMDMTGQAQIIRLLSKACRGEPFTSEEILSGTMVGDKVIPMLETSEGLPAGLSHQMKRTPTTPSHPPPDKRPPTCTWAYFDFSQASLAALKSVASNALPPTADFVSTDDALCAFIWQSITRARAIRLSGADKTQIARAVDVRRHLGISATYPGLLQNMTYHEHSVRELLEMHIGSIASELRAAIDQRTSDVRERTMALARFLHDSPDKGVVSFTADIDPSKDIMLSSWAKEDCYQLDFGLGLGKPVAVRRPRFTPVESLIYFMPKALDGEIAVMVALREDDMAALREDEEIRRYSSYIG